MNGVHPVTAQKQTCSEEGTAVSSGMGPEDLRLEDERALKQTSRKEPRVSVKG